MGTASDVEVSPDGKSVVTSSFLPGAIINWTRAASTGALSPKECFGSTQTIFPASGGGLLSDVCTDSLPPDTGGPADGLGYPLDLDVSPDGSKVYVAALGLEQDATVVGGMEVVPATDEPGSVAVFNRAANGDLNQPAAPNGCIDDTRDPVQPAGTCTGRTALLNPYRVSVSPDGANVYVTTLNVFPPSGVPGPGPGELSQFDSSLAQLTPPCLQQLGLPTGGLEPTAGCSLTALGLILPSDVAFAPDGSTAYVSSLFHSVGSYPRAANGVLTQDAPTTGCSIDPRNLPAGTELLAAVCQNAVPLNAPTSIEVGPDGKNAYVTSGGFLTGNPNFGPALAGAGITSDDAITVFGPTPPPPAPPTDEPPAPNPSCRGAEATIVAAPGKRVRGTGGDDVIVGSPKRDRIRSGGGDDTICARGGGDRVNAGGGGDVVSASGGGDRVSGGGGSDRLKGGGGKDHLTGNQGGDRLAGGGGRDRLIGGAGVDRCRPSGKDRLRGCERPRRKKR